MNNLNKKALLAVLLLITAKPACAGLFSGAYDYALKGGNYAAKGAAKGCGFIATKAVHHPIILAAVAATAATVGDSYLVYSKYFGKKAVVTDADSKNDAETSQGEVPRKSIFSRINIISPFWSWVKSFRTESQGIQTTGSGTINADEEWGLFN